MKYRIVFKCVSLSLFIARVTFQRRFSQRVLFGFLHRRTIFLYDSELGNHAQKAARNMYNDGRP